ncbi:MAG: CBS domain-containing protein [Planctomycetes bacterium]|nr:CBS domain-containing protein [Planctomycetota bacterium]
MFVRDIMTPDPVTVHQDDSMEFAKKCLSFAHVRHLPVVDDRGFLMGLVTHRDLLEAATRTVPGPITAKSLMRRDIRTVTPATDVRRAIQEMLEHKYGCLPVIEHGKVVGIVTEADFLKLVRSLLAIDPARNI